MEEKDDLDNEELQDVSKPEQDLEVFYTEFKELCNQIMTIRLGSNKVSELLELLNRYDKMRYNPLISDYVRTHSSDELRARMNHLREYIDNKLYPKEVVENEVNYFELLRDKLNNLPDFNKIMYGRNNEAEKVVREIMDLFNKVGDSQNVGDNRLTKEELKKLKKVFEMYRELHLNEKFDRRESFR